MEFVWFLIIGIISGIIAGMGMGGGTLLIPMLTLLMSVDQNLAQGINLIVFVPMAIVVCVIYFINKLVDFKNFLLIVIPAVIVSVLGSLVSFSVDKNVLRLIFGLFILLLGLIQLVLLIIHKIKHSK